MSMEKVGDVLQDRGVVNSEGGNLERFVGGLGRRVEVYGIICTMVMVDLSCHRRESFTALV